MSRTATRRELLRRAIATGGLGVAGPVVLSPSNASAAPAVADSDAAVMTRLLRLELLVLFAYQHVLASTVTPSDARQVVAELVAHEQAHVRALSAAVRQLGGTLPAGPANVAAADKDLSGRRVAGRLGQLRGERDGLRLLLALARVATGAYFVAISKLDDPALLRLSAEIMASEAQHATALSVLLHPGAPWQAVPYALVQGRH
jgi:hypothetical protein